MINVGMGAVFALGLLGIMAAIIIGASVVFFIISMIFLGFWIHRKVNKLDYQKVFKVSFIIYLLLSITVVGVPVGCVGITMADFKAERNTPPEDYINPGVELSVTASEIDDARGFEIDGVFYKRMSYDFYEYREDEVPIAKVKDEFENIYEVKNASGKRLLRYEGYIYCKESDMEFLEKFYTTLDDYDYYFYAYKGEKMKIDDFLDKEFNLTANAYGASSGVPDGTKYYYIEKRSPDGVYSLKIDICVTPSYEVYKSSGSYSYDLRNEELERKLKNYAIKYKHNYDEDLTEE
ncbi:MAG: hypothetical protein IKJ47_04170 [Oscillospiraceae bacterium]|nr:hypothetical protein [Oscillospiraceae bacterium]